ncbi:tyrosine-protein phosphatase non-receptor type 9-like [Bacillus rossius redtenbacheri]|uniref:tyrosine-protein phosphatase non-receptor type 9-like n=1 Tax=Bacillus rossius redtenbacheri TaxID=93214 RepID=UPI002FDDC556
MATNLFATYGTIEFLQRSNHPTFINIVAREHSSLLAVPITGTCKNFEKLTNKSKNRFLDTPCWDSSRVVLHDTKDGSDYINANYVSGFNLSKKFIATEHPMESTLNNFWTMVWEQEVRVIVMLGAMEESHPNNTYYFPYNQDNTIFSDFIVWEEKKINSKHYYIETLLSITHKETGESRAVHHFKYLDWPENNIPKVDNFLEFLLLVNNKYHDFFNPLQLGSIVVHGNAGIGRTATFCAVDTCLHQLVYTATISIPSVVLKIRQQRNSSIPALIQYIFINRVLYYFMVDIRSNFTAFLQIDSQIVPNDVDLLTHSLQKLVLPINLMNLDIKET